jgi:hypothetical protein
MAVGTYGTIRAADVSIDDIDAFYNYTANRETKNDVFIRLNATDIITYNYLPTDEQLVNHENLLEGIYNLNLPATIFNQLGFYTIYLRPKIILTTINDCGVLSALPTVKGILVDVNKLPANLTSNNALQGYRIEYINSDGTKMRNVVRYIVTSNKVSPITENVGNTTQKATRWRFDDAGTKIFLQVTPSSSSDVKPNATPFIGNAGQEILLLNTNFEPLVIEIEMVENTIDTLMDIVAGEQVKDVKKGILTHYDKDRVITKQFDLFNIKDDVTDVPLFEVKEKRTNIDENQNFDEVIGGI